MEGSQCFLDDDCDPADYVTPSLEYDHGTGCSIIGGEVYGRNDLPPLQGRYVLADYCGWVGTAEVAGDEVTNLQILDFGEFGLVTSLGFDADGRAYVLTTESVIRLRPAPID